MGNHYSSVVKHWEINEKSERLWVRSPTRADLKKEKIYTETAKREGINRERKREEEG
jgi:hypothetical protein